MKKLSLYLIISFVIFLNLIDKFFHEDPFGSTVLMKKIYTNMFQMDGE